jgi:hypothetical protein
MGTYEQYSFAKLIVKTLNDSYSQIKAKVPFELTSRYMGAFMQINIKDCKFYVSPAILNDTITNQICTQFPFSDLQKLQVFIAPLFYSSDPSKMAYLKA